MSVHRTHLRRRGMRDVMCRRKERRRDPNLCFFNTANAFFSPHPPPAPQIYFNIQISRYHRSYLSNIHNEKIRIYENKTDAYLLMICMYYFLSPKPTILNIDRAIATVQPVNTSRTTELVWRHAQRTSTQKQAPVDHVTASALNWSLLSKCYHKNLIINILTANETL